MRPQTLMLLPALAGATATPATPQSMTSKWALVGAHELLANRAQSVDHYAMPFSDPEPADLATRGLYADHIYF